MRDVADSFEMPEGELIKMVHTAFIEMMDADRYLILPLKLQQPARLLWSENIVSGFGKSKFRQAR
jgi:hypothetical protein